MVSSFLGFVASVPWISSPWADQRSASFLLVLVVKYLGPVGLFREVLL